MSAYHVVRGYPCRLSWSKDDDGFKRWNMDVLTVDGWVNASCLALDSETLDRETAAKLDELEKKQIKPGDPSPWQS